MPAISKDNFFKANLPARANVTPGAADARSTYEAEAAVRRAKMARLKALRLAKLSLKPSRP